MYQSFGCGRRGQRNNRMCGGHRQAHLAQLRTAITASAIVPLSRAERDDLLQMREEEKIARDVYLRLFDRWGLPPFANISGSEQIHMDAILSLIEHYDLRDPVQELDIGQFFNPDMQKLYEQLVARGLRSLEDAVQVGLLIEELDIADLRAAAQRTDKVALLTVYADLERGSCNHLRAFHGWMMRLGMSYVPTHISQADFESIASSRHDGCR